MTAPAASADPRAQPALDAAALAAEAAAVAMTVAPLAAALAGTVAALQLASTPAVRRTAARRLRGVSTASLGLSVRLRLHLPALRDLGWRQGGAVLRAQHPDITDWSRQAAAGGPLPDLVEWTLSEIDRRAVDDLAELADEVESGTDVEDIEPMADRTLRRARATAGDAAAAEIQHGVELAAADADAPMVWVAERDACLTCLAMSGQVRTAGGRWADLTFDDRPLSWAGWDGGPPPRHPRCRCRAWPHDGGPPVLAASVPGADAATGLAREARRSVLRGWSGYAGLARRLRAADRLVSSGTAALPRSVVARARRDIERGQFSERHVRKAPALRGGRR